MTLDEFRHRQANEKRCAILDGAQRVFLRDGYDGATIQKIADEAGVSTRTIYKHFENKESLFARLIEEAKRGHPEVCDVSILDDDSPPRDVLRRFGVSYAGLVTSDEWRDLMRVVIAKTGRTPACAEGLLENGSCPYINALQRYFERLGERGVLDIPDPAFAAGQLVSLISGHVFWPRLMVDSGESDPSTIERVVDEAVGMFLLRYQPRA